MRKDDIGQTVDEETWRPESAQPVSATRHVLSLSPLGSSACSGQSPGSCAVPEVLAWAPLRNNFPPSGPLFYDVGAEDTGRGGKDWRHVGEGT